MEFAEKWRNVEERDIAIMKACDSDVASGECADKQKYGHINIATCDCKIASEGVQSGKQTTGMMIATSISDYDIASEGVQSDRRNANEIGGGFLKSEESLLYRKKVLCIGGGFFLFEKGSY